MKKATLLPPPLFLKGGGGGGGHGRWMVQKQELPLSLNQSWFWFARVSACMCPHVYFTRLTRPLLIHQSCLPGCHTAFQHVSQSLCHMHYLRLMLTLMQIAAEMLDLLAYRPEHFSHRLWRKSVQISRPRVYLFYISAHLGVQRLPATKILA